MTVATAPDVQDVAVSRAVLDIVGSFSVANQPLASFAAVDTAIARIFGRCYTTILLIESGLETCRVFSTVPDTYPTGIRKSLPDNERTHRLFKEAIPFVANSLADIASAYPDHQTVRELGAVNLVNLPIVFDARVVGLLCVAGSGPPRDAAFTTKAGCFAQVLAPVMATLVQDRPSQTRP